MVRGFQPFPTTYTWLDEKKPTIWKAQRSTERTAADAGTIITAHGDDLMVACGDGSSLKISELQLEGKKRMSVRDFLNGTKLKSGDQLS